MRGSRCLGGCTAGTGAAETPTRYGECTAASQAADRDEWHFRWKYDTQREYIDAVEAFGPRSEARS